MENQKSYTNLKVWMQARRLSIEVYRITKMFPVEEKFGLVSQMRISAVSIASNIAEGCGRNYKKDCLQFFFIARGSLYELETQLYISSDLKYLNENVLNDGLSHIELTRKLLSGFINYYQQLER